MQNTKTIVVIKYEPAICESTAYNSRILGYTVHASHGTANKGLRCAKKHQTTFILLNLRMPVMNKEILEKLRQTEWGALTRVITLTCISRDEEPQSLRFLNVDCYTVKAHHVTV